MTASLGETHSAGVLNVSSRAFVESCQSLGMETQGLLAEVGVSSGVLRAPHGRIPLASARALFVRTAQAAATPGFGALVADSIPFGAYQLVDFLVGSAPTLRIALCVLARSLPLINPTIDVVVYESQGSLFFELRDPPALVYAEFILAVCCQHVRLAMRAEVPLSWVEFSHMAPADVEAQERVFACPVYYGAGRTRWCMDASVVDVVSPSADPALHRLLGARAEAELRRLNVGPSIVRQVRGVLREALEAERGATLKHVARELGVTSRTLQRRLKQEQRSFGEVLEELREELAYVYLERPELTLAEVGFRLGFAEQSSFGRAFKRWTGSSPGQWRG